MDKYHSRRQGAHTGHISSSYEMFARRGDPWLTAREIEKAYPSADDNPDMDRWTKASRVARPPSGPTPKGEKLSNERKHVMLRRLIAIRAAHKPLVR